MKELIGGKLAEESPADIAVRCEMINQLVELMLQEEIDEDDLVEFMDDWMEENMNVEALDASHKQMAQYLLKVRKELTFCAHNDLDLNSGSKTLNYLMTLNQANRENMQE